jgi:hypothetical protein
VTRQIIDPALKEYKGPLAEPNPYPWLPTYSALMMAHGGGVDIDAGSAAALEARVRCYIAEYDPECPRDIAWNAAVLQAVVERRFVAYGRGRVRAEWPTLH